MNEAKRITRVAIIDDEPLAREHVADRLSHEDNVEIVGTASDGNQAIELIRATRPDLVFLDIQMPGRTGFQVIEAIGAADMPVTIFTTAYDEFALKAFEVAAADYLVKPFDDERFSHAFERARQTVELKEVGRVTKQLLSLLQAPEAPGASVAVAEVSSRPQYLTRIPVELRGQMRVVPVDRIDYVTASGPYAELHVGDRTYAVRERMQTLEEQLDPAVFMRVHRSVIVRLERIESLKRASGGDYAVRLRDGTELSVSRAKRDELERRMLGT